MRLSVMTSQYRVNSTNGGYYSFVDSIRELKKCGFDVFDCNLCMLSRAKNECEFTSDDESCWRAEAERLRDEAKKIGAEFYQAHLPYPKANVRRKKADDDGCEKNQYFIDMTFRAIEICAVVGVKWAVVHPVTCDNGYDAGRAANVAYNHEIYDKYAAAAKKHGIGLAFENMADVDGCRRFGVTAEELCEIVDSFEPGTAGACWDFGHANRAKLNQAQNLRRLGARLKATHVDDNVGTEDLHTLPYLGTIDWNSLMPVLTEIGYDGVFNYELATNKRMPDALKESASRFSADIGRYLISLS